MLADSPKSAAALARRCLQTVLREAGGTASKDLFDQIDEVLPKLPSHLADAIDGVRNIGNIAAHSMKAIHTGDILPVEPGEAEWTLDTLEAALDFYYVQPALLKAKRAALDAKLAQAGKPPMK